MSRRNRIALVLTTLFVLSLCALPQRAAHGEKAAFRIGVVTLGLGQTVDAYQGAQRMVQEYGAASKNGMIHHLALPENFATSTPAVTELIESLAEDPEIKVIVVNEAVPGTHQAFTNIKKNARISSALRRAPTKPPT